MFEKNDPVMFAVNRLPSPSALRRAVDAAKEKERARQEQKRKQAEIDARVGLPFTIACGNINCTSVVAYEYQGPKSERKAIAKHYWRQFPGMLLCPICTEIQLSRMAAERDYKVRKSDARYRADWIRKHRA